MARAVELVGSRIVSGLLSWLRSVAQSCVHQANSLFDHASAILACHGSLFPCSCLSSGSGPSNLPTRMGRLDGCQKLMLDLRHRRSSLPGPDAVPDLLQMRCEAEGGWRWERDEVPVAHDVVERVEMESHALSTSAVVELDAHLSLVVEGGFLRFCAGRPECLERVVVEPS